MAGIYDRLTAIDDNLSINLFHAAFILKAKGEFTDAQILSALNGALVNPLAGAELTDLSNVAAEMDAQVGTVDKIVYGNTIRSAAIAAVEAGVTDGTFRSILNIA